MKNVMFVDTGEICTQEDLQKRLSRIGWERKSETLLPEIEWCRILNQPGGPVLSIIIISIHFSREVLQSLEELSRQRPENSQLIFVINGVDEGEFKEILPHTDVLMKLRENKGAYLARNCGALVADAPMLLFLDDDATPGEGLIDSHIRLHRRYEAISVRGVCLPKTATPLNSHPKHYYLGDLPFPRFANIEGNTSYRAESFFAAGGWDDDIVFGGGGLTLAMRLLQIDPDLRKHVYSPDPVIFHDYARDTGHIRKKFEKQLNSRRLLWRKFPQHTEAVQQWDRLRGKTGALIVRDPSFPERLSQTRGQRNHVLYETLERHNWLHRFGWYDFLWDGIEVLSQPQGAFITTIFVAEAPSDNLCKHAADVRDGAAGCRTLIVNNGGAKERWADASRYCDAVVHLRHRTETNTARNIGAAFAGTPLLLFLHPDDEPMPRLARLHLERHRQQKLASLEGRLCRNAPASSQPRCIYPVEHDHISFSADEFFIAKGFGEILYEDSPLHELVLGILSFTLEYGLHRFDPGLFCISGRRESPSHEKAADPKNDVCQRLPLLGSMYRHWLQRSREGVPPIAHQSWAKLNQLFVRFRQALEQNDLQQGLDVLRQGEQAFPLSGKFAWLGSIAERSRGNFEKALRISAQGLRAYPLSVNLILEYLESLRELGATGQADSLCAEFLRQTMHYRVLEEKIRIEMTAQSIQQTEKRVDLPIRLEYGEIRYGEETRTDEDVMQKDTVSHDALKNALSRCGWANRFNRYAPYLLEIRGTRESVPDPAIAVILISHRDNPDTIVSLRHLDRQRDVGVQVIFVDNGAGREVFRPLEPYVDLMIHLSENTGAYLARNIGAVFTEAPVVYFLDDDAIPDDHLLQSHLNIHRKLEIIAIRGVCRPKTDNPLNRIADHLYLGDKPYPRFGDLEGNISYHAQTFFRAGGWDDNIRFGHGAIDLCFRLLQIEPDRRKQIYHPAPVIYHDYAGDREHLQRKKAIQAQTWQYLNRKHGPAFRGFLASWDPYKQRSDLLIGKDSGEKMKAPVDRETLISQANALLEKIGKPGAGEPRNLILQAIEKLEGALVLDPSDSWLDRQIDKLTQKVGIQRKKKPSQPPQSPAPVPKPQTKTPPQERAISPDPWGRSVWNPASGEKVAPASSTSKSSSPWGSPASGKRPEPQAQTTAAQPVQPPAEPALPTTASGPVEPASTAPVRIDIARSLTDAEVDHALRLYHEGRFADLAKEFGNVRHNRVSSLVSSSLLRLKRYDSALGYLAQFPPTEEVCLKRFTAGALQKMDRITLNPEPRVHILLLSYNREDWVENALKQLAATNYSNYALFIADNNSSDKAWEVINKSLHYFPKHVRIEKERLITNIGRPVGHNWLLEKYDHSGADYIAIGDDDLISVPPDWLRDMIKTMELYDDVAVVGAKAFNNEYPRMIHGGVRNFLEFTTGKIRLSHGKDEPDWGQYDYIDQVDHVIGCLHIHRRKILFDDLGLFDLRLSPCQYVDIEHHLRTRLKGFKILYNGLIDVAHLRGMGKAAASDKTLAGNSFGNLIKISYLYRDKGVPEFIDRTRREHANWVKTFSRE